MLYQPKKPIPISEASLSAHEANKEVCPVTGLPIYTRPEWTNINFGSDYFLTLKVAGDSILLCEAYGNAVLKDSQEALMVTAKVISDVFGTSRYVQLEDYSNLRSYSLEARSHYINEMKQRDQMLALIFHSIPLILKMTIQLGKRLHMTNFDVLLAPNYERAINKAWNILNTYRENFKNNALFSDKKMGLKANDTGGKLCPNRNLPLISKPEWGSFALGHQGSVVFKPLENRILLSCFYGTIDEKQAQKYHDLKTQIIEEIRSPQKEIFNLYDLSGLKGSCFSNFRFFKKILRSSHPLTGHIAFETPNQSFLQKNLLKTIPELKIAKTYPEAKLRAIDILKQKEITNKRLVNHVYSQKDWELELDGFSIRFEIINSEIIHSIPRGDLNESHLPYLIELREKVIRTLLMQGNFNYFISDAKQFSIKNTRVRKRYVKTLQDIHQRYPFRIFFYYGRNKFIQTAVNLTKPFLAFKVRGCENLEHALELVSKDKAKGMKNKTITKLTSKLFPSDRHTEKYVNDLLSFLGNIDWEKDGFYGVDNYTHSHPFSRVFDSIRFIKKDLDNLLEERKEVEKALRQSEEKYRTVLDAIGDGYYEMDLEGKLIFFNDALCRLMETTHEQLQQAGIKEFMDADNHRIIQQHMEQVFDTEAPAKSFHIKLHTMNGNNRFVEISMSPVFHAEKHPVGFRGIIRDIDDRLRSESLLKQKEAAEQANIAKSAFLANVSHELITPMHGILSFSRFGIDQSGKASIEKLYEYFSEINKCGNTLMGLLTDLLHLSKLELGEITCQMAKNDIQKIVDSVVLESRPKAKIKNITIVVHYSNISTEAEFDDRLITRMIEIILTNAIEYGDSGGKISIFFEESKINTATEPVESIRVHVADEGVGIPDDELTQVFNTFFQSTRTKTSAGGRGLGLAICKEIILLHKGKIWAEHNPSGKGSVFILELPRKAICQNLRI